MAGLRFQLVHHLAQDALERLDRNLAPVLIEYLDETRHVRALEVVRQVHVHVEAGDGVLDAVALVLDDDRMADALDADLVDRQLAGVGQILHVGDDVCFR